MNLQLCVKHDERSRPKLHSLSIPNQVRPNDLVEKYRFGPCPVCPSEPLPKTTDEASSAVTGTSPTARPVHHVSLHENPYFHSKAARTHYAPNIYPPFQFDAGRLEAAVRSLYCAMEQLALILVEIFEKVLQMPPRFLARWFCNHRHTSILTLNSYPPLSDAILQRAHRQGQFRVAAHTDVSLFTLLLMDKPCLQGGGLQIQCARTGEGQCKSHCTVICTSVHLFFHSAYRALATCGPGRGEYRYECGRSAR